MQLYNLELRDFRNYKEEYIEFAPGVNIFIGNNGQGKSNLLEAVNYLSVGKSPRIKLQTDLIRWGCDKFLLKAACQCADRSLTMESHMNREKKVLKINGVPLKKLSEYIGTLVTVFFYPDDLNLLKKGPTERRKFIDQLISQNKPFYISMLNTYLKILKQKNNLLRQRGDVAALKSQLQIWNEQLFQAGSRIIENRLLYTGSLRENMAESFYYLFGENQELELIYQSCGKSDYHDIVDNFAQQLENHMDQEIEQRTALYGPHRDDILVLLNGRPARYFASQGQQRALVLSMKLSEMEIIIREKGEPPLLLLDDIFSELDEIRQDFLMNYIVAAGQQTLVSLTHLDTMKDLRNSGQIFRVRNGVIN
ncbi:MAG: DNA replication/repair protein RecF [Peptococcaceae bacterium]|jgi:DNA replication and repair protein RecF|nr:DNA replication/repair protein RecF [Peptococcaceae bacterium]